MGRSNHAGFNSAAPPAPAAIPTIDAAQLTCAHERKKFDQACAQWGLCTVVNHGLHESVRKNLFAQATDFFHQAAPNKRRILRTATNPWGYYDSELTKNTPDWKEIFDYGPAYQTMKPQWPDQPGQFKAAMLEFYAACETLAFRLLDVMALNLQTTGSTLRSAFAPQHASFARLNFYPICTDPENPPTAQTPISGHLGVNHHTDSGVLTILLQDAQAGLEVYKNNRWHAVPTIPGAITVNLGDVAQVWSNDRYRAPLHRVRANAEQERLSAPFFFNPAYTASYAPLPNLINAAAPARYRPIQWEEFRRRRSAGDYANQGQEVQISDYALVAGSPAPEP